MADLIFQRCLLFVFLIFCLFFIASVDGLARRGGSGRSSRSYGVRTSYVRSTRVKVTNVVLSGRIVRGSSGYSSSNWRAALAAGIIYQGMRPRHYHTNTMPTICTNNVDKRPDGLIYGYFICPLESDLGDEVYCCGPERREYCCNKTVAEMYYTKHYQNRSSGPSIGSIIGIVVTGVVVIIVAVICCKKRKTAGQIIRKFSKRARRPKHDYQGPQTVPLNTVESMHADTSTVIQGPPPSYMAATAVGYDGTQPYPYVGPQPYLPGAPQPYPPYSITDLDEKSGAHPPEIMAGEPYKSYHTDATAPFAETAGNSPYPPPQGDPYPPPVGAPFPGAPYPPPSGAPYPPTAGAPYPPPSGAPYPYPAPYDAPYPPTAGTPYPTSPQQMAQNYGTPYPTSEPVARSQDAGDHQDKNAIHGAHIG